MENTGTFESLEGKLLLAETTLRDPNFFRSVIYLTQHTEQGAHGFVINQPMEHKVSELLAGKEFEVLADVPVYKGGPVAAERMTFATMGWDNRRKGFSFQSHLSTQDAIDAQLAGKDVRAYVGYSGWTSGQVEAEIESHSWIVQDALPLLAEPEVVPYLWYRLLEGMGPFFQLISLMPERPELN